MPTHRPPPQKLPLTPRQLRLIYPLTKQAPARALANVTLAYLIWPGCICEVALEAYLDTLKAVLNPVGRPTIGRRGQR
ncbi:MAG TPA: hypothetical protein PKY50_19330 [Candidatus Competibacter sp.]|nr:hypothetical protein [Candidatus Competibacter sp.]